MGHLVQAFKEQFSKTSSSDTLTNPNGCMDASLSNVQELPIDECKTHLCFEFSSHSILSI